MKRLKIKALTATEIKLRRIENKIKARNAFINKPSDAYLDLMLRKKKESKNLHYIKIRELRKEEKEEEEK